MQPKKRSTNRDIEEANVENFKELEQTIENSMHRNEVFLMIEIEKSDLADPFPCVATCTEPKLQVGRPNHPSSLPQEETLGLQSSKER